MVTNKTKAKEKIKIYIKNQLKRNHKGKTVNFDEKITKQEAASAKAKQKYAPKSCLNHKKPT